MAKDKKHNFPSFIDWAYTKWYFWTIVGLYTLWSGYESIVSGSPVEIISTLIAVIFIVSLFFVFAYILARNNCKKLNHI